MVSLHTGKNSTHTGMAGVCFYNLKLICMKWESTSTADIVVDSVVESVISKIRSRSNVGIKKYNTTMDRNDLSNIDWLNHLQEELMDAIIYVEKLKSNI